MIFPDLVDGVFTFSYGVLTTISNFCFFNPFVLAFLSVTSLTLGIRVLKRVISALGRGH